MGNSMFRVLGVIPARGGSKGIPRKNIRPLRGRPLLAYTADAALAARHLDRVLLTTDDPEIAEVGRSCGLDVRFLRPAELARDDTPSLPVVQHAAEWAESAWGRFDAVCLLQPTNPLRTAAHIDACIELLETQGLDAVVTILAIPHEHHPLWAYYRDPDGLLRLASGASVPPPRRQDLPEAFHREGSVYVTCRDVLMVDGSLYGRSTGGVPIDPERSVNLDNPRDWERAEHLIIRFQDNGAR
jgi:CMP-N,N'-diacetyllegionaminic acid synthase